MIPGDGWFHSIGSCVILPSLQLRPQHLPVEPMPSFDPVSKFQVNEFSKEIVRR